MKKFAVLIGSVALVVGTSMLATGDAIASSPGYYGAADYQGDIAHQGYAGPALPASMSVKWSQDFGGLVSYPVIVSNRMYFTVQTPEGSNPGVLYAVSATTGATLWGPVALPTRYSAVSWDNGQLFVQLGNGVLQAYNGSTGNLNWSVQLPTGAYSSPPTATGGVVYTANALLSAVSETTGSVEWSRPVENGDHSAPSVDSTGVYVSYAGELSYKFSTGGVLLWNHSNNIEGGGGRTTVVHNSKVWVRDDAGMAPAILDAATGQSVGNFSGLTVPAFYAGTAITTTATGLQAMSVERARCSGPKPATANWPPRRTSLERLSTSVAVPATCMATRPSQASKYGRDLLARRSPGQMSTTAWYCKASRLQTACSLYLLLRG